MAWLVDASSDLHDIHVMPVDDLKPHLSARGCWCRPVEDSSTVLGEHDVLIHNAMDCRERHEAGLPLH